MIEARRAQRSFAEGLLAEEVTDLWEDWMRAADQSWGAISRRSGFVLQVLLLGFSPGFGPPGVYGLTGYFPPLFGRQFWRCEPYRPSAHQVVREPLPLAGNREMGYDRGKVEDWYRRLETP